MRHLKSILVSLAIAGASVAGAHYLASLRLTLKDLLLPTSIPGFVIFAVGSLRSSERRNEPPPQTAKDGFVLVGLLVLISAPAAMATLWAWHPEQLKRLVRIGAFLLSGGGALIGYAVLHAELTGLADKLEYTGTTLGVPQLVVELFGPQ